VLSAGHELVERGVLEGHPENAPHRSRLGGDIHAVHEGRARGRAHQGGEDPHGGRLAGSIAPQQAEDLAPGDLEADALEGVDASRLVPLGQLTNLDGRLPRRETRYGGSL